MLNAFTEKWKNKYPNVVTNMNRNKDFLFTPNIVSIRRSIRSTNMIKRMNKEIRRSIKVIDSLPTVESAKKDYISKGNRYK